MTTLAHTTGITRIAIVVEDSSGNVAQLIATITALVAMLVSLSRFVNEVALLISDIAEAMGFTAAVFAIGLKAAMWGFWGIRL